MLSKLLRFGEGRMLKRLEKLAQEVEALDQEYSALSDEQLKAKTGEFKERLERGVSLDDILIEAFATVREAAFRVLQQKPYHVQIMGGAALHFGNIAEMRTGEGKTLTCVMPAYLNALSGKGVHVVTTNDYLARRDAEWMGRVHRFVGLNVGVILPGQDSVTRKLAYEADITYGTNNEFGFDYLRDNMVPDKSLMVQRGHNFAIVDEVDSILIDEARTPLIISGPAESSSKWYTEFARIAKILKEDEDYEVDLKKQTIGVTERGISEVEKQLGIDNLYESTNATLVSYLNNSLKALKLFEKDKDYIVNNNEVVIVDEFTGRVLTGRRFNEGLHQAIEAKEGVEIQAENQTLATITLQNYFRMYAKLAGMTGTAETEAAEFHQIYHLGVVSIPPNKTIQRIDHSDLVYRTEVAKFNAIVDDIKIRHAKGQPILVGTASVERSEYLSSLLTKEKIAHNVLNAKNHENEALIIAQAGVPGTVTVSTNMAGRGTDIVLGGNEDVLIDAALRSRGLDPIEHEEEYQKGWDELLSATKEQAEKDAAAARAAGGLYVIGTERHDSRRIDNQLRGRTGRQGDPGETRFFISVQDELMRRFNGERLGAMMQRFGISDDIPIEHKYVTNAIRSAQSQVEQLNFEIRKNVLKYDEVMNEQRKKIYSERSKILDNVELRPTIISMIDSVISAYVKGATGMQYSEDWDIDTLWEALGNLYPISLDKSEIFIDENGNHRDLSAEELTSLLSADAQARYQDKINAITELTNDPNVMHAVERNILLAILDQKWQEHLYEMDYLKEGISLRAMAQRDPLIEYQHEGFAMFEGMIDSLREETIRALFSAQVTAIDSPDNQSGVPELILTRPETPESLPAFSAEIETEEFDDDSELKQSSTKVSTKSRKKNRKR